MNVFILSLWEEFFDNNPALMDFIMFFVLFGIAIAIVLLFELYNLIIVVLLYGLIVIFLYAWGEIGLLFASSGFIAIAIAAYIIFFDNNQGNGSQL